MTRVPPSLKTILTCGPRCIRVTGGKDPWRLCRPSPGVERPRESPSSFLGRTLLTFDLLWLSKRPRTPKSQTALSMSVDLPIALPTVPPVFWGFGGSKVPGPSWCRIGQRKLPCNRHSKSSHSPASGRSKYKHGRPSAELSQPPCSAQPSSRQFCNGQVSD